MSNVIKPVFGKHKGIVAMAREMMVAKKDKEEKVASLTYRVLKDHFKKTSWDLSQSEAKIVKETYPELME